MNPKYGIVAGTSILYDTEETTVKPGFIDENGMIVLDKDGMPRNSNFFLDLRDGSAYFRGTVYANGGRFKGSVYGDNYYFNDGGNVRTLINEAGVDFSKMKRIDLGGIVLDGETGNISFTGAGSITWGDNTPVKYQFSVDGKTGWHDTMQANDKYRRDSLDGGTTWGTPYQFRGTDGKNGANGTVDYTKVNQILKETYGITETYITEGKIGSPVIQGAEIYGGKIYAGDGSGLFAEMDSGGFEIRVQNGGTCIGFYPTTTGTMIDKNGEDGAIGCAHDLLLYSAFGAVCVVGGVGNRHEVLHNGSTIHCVFA